MILLCPACSSTKIKSHSSYRLRQKSNDYLAVDYQLLICNNCGLWFKDNIPSEELLKLHYERLVAEVSPWNYASRLPHEQKLDNILSTLLNDSKVLDVGCWTGRLLSTHYPRLKVYGIEPNSSAAKIAQENGLHILGSEVTESLSSFGSFDCITMVDVFEHLREPMKILNCLLSVLSPGGRLLIVTGRTDCFPVWLAGSSYWYFLCPQHLVFLNKRFCHWFQENKPEIKVSYMPIRHFDFQLPRFFYELAWLVCWRFLSPHSPMLKPALYKLPGFKRFERLREPVMCHMWKDHILLEIKKTL